MGMHYYLLPIHRPEKCVPKVFVMSTPGSLYYYVRGRNGANSHIRETGTRTFGVFLLEK